MSIRNIFFDMDGTLFSSEKMIYPVYSRGISSFNRALSCDVPIPSMDEIMGLLGYPVEVIYDNLFPSLSLDDRRVMRSFIQGELIAAIERREGLLYEGVYELVSYLSDLGMRLFIASNGHHKYLSTILGVYSLSGSFAELVTLDTYGVCDKGDILFEYARHYGLSSGDSLMVGDRLSDLEASLKYSCDFIFCEYGYGGGDNLGSFNDTRVSSVFDLMGHLKSLLFIS